MLKIFRNREVNLYFFSIIFMGGAGILLSFMQRSNPLWPCLAIIGILVLSFWFTRFRYLKLSRLSRDLERIMRGNYQMDISAYAEGELNILASDLMKITRILSHQAAALQKDKTYLADSIADISHQLKTPLTSLSMMCDLLGDPMLPEEKRQEFLNHIRLGVARIQWLVSALLKLSRLDAGAVQFSQEPLDMKALLLEAAAPFQIPMEIKNLTLTMDIKDNVPFTGDRTWLLEAFSNLLKNCVEYTPEGGRIEVHGAGNNLYMLVEIKDSGPGFSTEDIPYLFDRFYKGKNAAADSVGIGLALSKSIISRHNGIITAENRQPGTGAVFTVKFYGNTIL